MPIDLFKIKKIDLKGYLRDRLDTSLILDIQPVSYRGLIPTKDLYMAINLFVNEAPGFADAVIEYSYFEDSDVKKHLKYPTTRDLSHLVYVEMSGLAIITFNSFNKNWIFH